MSYNVQISEAQRVRIVEALKAYNAAHPVEEGDLDNEYLVECLEQVPADEAETPRVTHGLCL